MNEPARTLLRGPFAEGDVATRLVASTRRDTPASAASVEAAWERMRDTPGLNLFDGPMCRLEMFHVEHLPNLPPRLVLSLSRTGYKIFLGTNLHGPRDLPPQTLANPVGVSPALETADGFLLFGRRNGRVAYYPHRLHPFSGSLEPTPPTADGSSVDVFAECRRELGEELNLTAAEVPHLALLGIVEDGDIRHPELILHARTTRTRDEVTARLDPAEHAAAEAVAATAEGVAAALERPDFTPVGRAVLTLWRAHGCAPAAVAWREEF